MVIRIPDFLFAQGTGEVTGPGELDFETRNALVAARSTEQEISSLNRGLTLAGEAMKGGGKARQQLAAARDALGQRGNSGALRWLLDHAAAERARQEVGTSRRTGMRTLIGAIKTVGSLPVPFAEKAELGRTLLQQGVEHGLVALEDHPLFESAVISQFGLMQAQTALAQAVEPGQALTVLAAAKDEGALMQPDLELLERRARERDAVAIARHQARLAGKEQDDLAAFARGELPEPPSEHSFTLVHGAQGAADAYARYQGARKEGEAIASIRGKDAEGSEAARAEWQGDPAVFERAVVKDAQRRLRDPAGYALETVPGAKAAWDEAPETERGALLWSAQAAAGIPEAQRSLWTLAQEAAMADEWAALPSGYGGRSEKLAFFKKHLLSLPGQQRPAALARLVRQGIADGTELELQSVLTELEHGRINLARKRTALLGAASTGVRSASPLLNPQGKDPQRGSKDDRNPDSPFTRAQSLGRSPRWLWPGQPSPEETARTLQRAWDALVDLLTIDGTDTSPQQAPFIDVLPPQKPEPQRDFDIEEARQIAEGLFGPGLEPVDLGPVFTITGFTIEDFGSDWIKEVFPNLSQSLPQITILDNSRGSAKTQQLNHRVAQLLNEAIYKASKVRPSWTKIWYGKYTEKKHMSELILKEGNTTSLTGSSRPDVSIEMNRGVAPSYSFEVPITKNCKIHVNTIDTRLHSRPTTRERDAAIRILRNMETCDVLILIPKLKKGETLNEAALSELFDLVATEMAKPSWEQDWREQRWNQRFELFKHSP
jgi:hypothetical protein